jgi:NACHT N-terminal Helical domain 7
VPGTLSYTDAVKLLGGSESKTVGAIDRLLGGLLLAASAAGGGFALSLFEPSRHLASLSGALVAGLGEKLRGLGRFDRSERLAAAHAVIVLTAYFEVLAETDLPFDVRELELTKAEQIAVTTSGVPGSSRLGKLAADLLRAPLPMPTPQWPYELTLEALHSFYDDASDQVLQFMSGLAVWERISDASQSHFEAALTGGLSDRSVGRYEILFRKLAADFPEVGFWANLVDHRATRAEIRRLSAGFAGLEQGMASIAAGRAPDARRAELAQAYRAGLDRPILAAGDAPRGLVIPTLAAAYVNPDFRVAEIDATDSPSEEPWWVGQPVRDDLEGFLLGHLTAPQATRAPLVVLGQPGSGKSVLTRVLAARLPASEFLVVRVSLREVPADADLQAQVEYAIRAATGEPLTWPALARTADDALLVALLDGFDELLQATGASQSDYLERITDFQCREADLGRPVAVIVTSRTAVADRARFTDGAVAVRLEPFRDTQIVQWLETWNDANAAYFTTHGVDQLAPEAVMAHQDLASQPLLLMMLALYDADRNALQRAEARLGHAELYERLLTRFSRREVQKTSAALSDLESRRESERDLLRLSVVAFSMFNRGRQWVTEEELDTDLPQLLGNASTHSQQAGLRAALTAAQVVIGRFFFVHEAQATRDGIRLRTCEFLHATFGEYLIARLITRELDDLAEVVERNDKRSRPTPADDAFLYALLSFSPLTIRGSTISFLQESIQSLPATRRKIVSRLLLSLFRSALYLRPDSNYRDYIPVGVSAPARHAAYSANLLVLAVLAAGEVTGQQLFPEADDQVFAWRASATLWRSQLSSEGWTGMIETLTFDRGWDGDQRYFRLRLTQDEPENIKVDPYWTYAFCVEPWNRHQGHSWTYSTYEHQCLKNRILCQHSVDALSHALEPMASELGVAIQTFSDCGQDHPVSAANALIRLWIASGQDSTPADLAAAYAACLQIAMRAFSALDAEARDKYRTLILRQLAADRPRLPESWIDNMMAQLSSQSAGVSDFVVQISNILDPAESANHDCPATAEKTPRPKR